MLQSQAMNTWAVIKTGGKQYKVEEGQSLKIEKLDTEKGKTISFDEVLAIGGDKVSIGTPLVEKAKVTAKVLDEVKDKKIRVVKFKSKSKYLRTKGHRHQRTQILIEKISL